MKRFFVACGAACALLFSNTYADTPVELDNIRVTGSRDAIEVPYQKVYDYARRVESASDGRVRFALRMLAAHEGISLEGLRIAIASDNVLLPLTLLPGNIMPVPAHEQLARERGSFVVNRKKGELKGQGTLLAAAPEQPWTLGRVRQVIADRDRIKEALGEIVPWYMRMFMFRYDSVAVCSRNAGEAVQLRLGDTLLATVYTDKADRNDAGEAVFCHRFKTDAPWADEVQVLPPSGAEVILL